MVQWFGGGRYLHRRAQQAWSFEHGMASYIFCVSFSEEAARDMKGLSTPHGLCGDRARRVHGLALLVTFPMIWVASRV